MEIHPLRACQCVLVYYLCLLWLIHFSSDPCKPSILAQNKKNSPSKYQCIFWMSIREDWVNTKDLHRKLVELNPWLFDLQDCFRQEFFLRIPLHRFHRKLNIYSCLFLRILYFSYGGIKQSLVSMNSYRIGVDMTLQSYIFPIPTSFGRHLPRINNHVYQQ